MKIPQRLGFLVNYHARDDLAGLEKAFNKQQKSHKVKTGEPKGLDKTKAHYKIKATQDSTPLLQQFGNISESHTQEAHLLPVPHSQQSSPNGCVDACLDMLGCYFNCASLRAKVKTRSDGLRLMPDTARPLTKGITDDEAMSRLSAAGLKSYAVQPSAENIKKALESGPILACVDFAFGQFRHAVVIVGYLEDSVIINDPWRGGHRVKKIDKLLKHLRDDGGSPALILITK